MAARGGSGSDGSENDMDVLAEQEIAKLHRQYRIMEGDRKTYCEESTNTIRKQKAQLAKLQVKATSISVTINTIRTY